MKNLKQTSEKTQQQQRDTYLPTASNNKTAQVASVDYFIIRLKLRRGCDVLF